MEESIPFPVIDMKQLCEQEEYCNKLREACEKWGCFRIISHPISASLMADMKLVAASLHELPVEIKKRNAEVISGSGYVPPSGIRPLYEGLGVYDIAGSSQALHDFCSQLDVTPHQRYGVIEDKHRVQCIKPATRLSIGAFMLGPTEGNVEAPPELVDPTHPRLYQPFKYQHYRDLRFATGKRDGETLDHFRITT